MDDYCLLKVVDTGYYHEDHPLQSIKLELNPDLHGHHRYRERCSVRAAHYSQHSAS